jgi:hypothetical protein
MVYITLKENFMFKKIVFTLMFLLIPLSLMAQPITFFDNLIKREGFNFVAQDNQRILYGIDNIAIIVNVDHKGNINYISTGFDDKKSPTKYITVALAASYVTLQLQMGKTQVLEFKNLVRKMYYLIDTIKSNLKINNKTDFRYDDMFISAAKEKDLIFINMR